MSGASLPADIAFVEIGSLGSRASSTSGGAVPIAETLGVDASADALRAAVERCATEWVCVLSGPASIRPGGVASARRVLAAEPDAVGLFSDTAISTSRGSYVLKRPVFDPERLRCQYYLGPAVVYRRSHLLEAPLLQVDTAFGMLYDAALRAALRGSQTMQHQRAPLVERGAADDRRLSDGELDDARRLLDAYLGHSGGGVVRAVGGDGVHDTRRIVHGEPLVSIVIPTRAIFSETEGGRHCFVVDAVKGIVDGGSYRNLEFVIVADSVADPEVLGALSALAGDRLRLVEWDQPFNFSDKVNLGVVHATGDFVLILNDDVQVLTPDWIETMLALAQLPNAGMVGAMLYYEDDTIQHAGHAYFDDEASHIGLDRPRGFAGPLEGFRVERAVAGVTAACALMPRSVFFEAGGFTGLLPGNFNDVDLCMKVTWLGYDIYWTPHAELYHFESKTRNPTVHRFEVGVTWGRWGHRMHSPEHWPYPLDRPPAL